MKFVIVFTLLSSTITIAQVSRSNPITDMFEITRTAIRIGIEDLRNTGSGGSPIEHKDFERILQKFTQKVEKELQNYSADYEMQVLNPLKRDIENYNSVKSSAFYTAEEKKLILSELFVKIQGDAKRATETFYNSKMPNLFAAVIDHPEVMVLELNDPQIYARRGSLANIEVYGGKAYNFKYEKIDLRNYSQLLSKKAPELYFISHELQRSTYSIYKGCLSSSCLSLLTVAYKKYLKILDGLSRKIEYQLDTNRIVTFPEYVIKLEGYYRYPSNVPDYEFKLSMVINRFLEESFKFFASRPMNFSIDINELDLLDEMVEVAGSAKDLEQCRIEMSKLNIKYCVLNTANCKSADAKMILSMDIREDDLLDDIKIKKRKAEKELAAVMVDYLRIKKRLDNARNSRRRFNISRKLEPYRVQKESLEDFIFQANAESIKLRQQCLQGIK